MLQDYSVDPRLGACRVFRNIGRKRSIMPAIGLSLLALARTVQWTCTIAPQPTSRTPCFTGYLGWCGFLLCYTLEWGWVARGRGWLCGWLLVAFVGWAVSGLGLVVIDRRVLRSNVCSGYYGCVGTRSRHVGKTECIRGVWTNALHLPKLPPQTLYVRYVVKRGAGVEVEIDLVLRHYN